MKNFKNFEKETGLDFKNKDLLAQAFAHRSYINENSSWSLGHNERLEFLGDAVLELTVTEYLFNKFPKKTEGDMTSLRASLVNSNTLSETASDLKMGDYLLLSKGETKDIGKARQYILANTFEAVVGAIYLDQGYSVVFSFLKKYLFEKIGYIMENRLWIDAKSLFQEKAQEFVGITPNYKVLSESGPDHDKEFSVGVFLENEIIGEGKGSSKQEAEQNAARNALKVKSWED